MPTSMSEYFDTLSKKFCNDFQAYQDWCDKGDDFTHDFGIIYTNQPISLYNQEKHLCHNLESVIFCARGITCRIASTQVSYSWIFPPFQEVHYNDMISGNDYHTFRIDIPCETYIKFTGRINFNNVKELLRNRNRLVRNVLEQEFKRIIQPDNLLELIEKSGDPIGLIANLDYFFPEAISSIPKYRNEIVEEINKIVRHSLELEFERIIQPENLLRIIEQFDNLNGVIANLDTILPDAIVSVPEYRNEILARITEKIDEIKKRELEEEFERITRPDNLLNIIGNCNDIDDIIENLDDCFPRAILSNPQYRSDIIKKVMNLEVEQTVLMSQSLSNNASLIDAISNFYDAFPKNIFEIPRAYLTFSKQTIDGYYREHFCNITDIPSGSYQYGGNISAIDFNAAKQMMDYLSEYMEDEYHVPKWCSHTVAYFFVRREAISRMLFEAENKYGMVCDYPDRRSFVLNCLETGKLLTDDYAEKTLVAWCITNDDCVYVSIPDPFFENLEFIESVVKEYEISERKSAFNRMLKKPRKSEQDIPTQAQVTMDDVDLMTGVEFEAFISSLFQKMGFQVSQTKISGDQGIDVIAEKGTMRIGIQAKCYGGSVGNSAVQEAVAGQAYYNLNKAMVVTNSQFTPSAIALAQANNVVLWDRNILADKLSLIR